MVFGPKCTGLLLPVCYISEYTVELFIRQNATSLYAEIYVNYDHKT